MEQTAEDRVSRSPSPLPPLLEQRRKAQVQIGSNVFCILVVRPLEDRKSIRICLSVINT